MTKELSKLYRVYVIRDEDDNNLKEPLLYGVTNNKDIIDKFKKQRDMSKFHIRVTTEDKKLTLNVVDRFKGYMLVNAGFKHKSNFVNIVCTAREEEEIALAGDQILLDEIKKHLINPEVLQDKYIEYLYAIGYLEFYKYIIEPLSPMYEGINNEYLNYGIYDIDELNMFISKYGWSLKQK